MTAPDVGKELGRLFEVGFNIGMLAYIEQNQLSHRFGDLYRQDLQQLSFPKMLKQLASKADIISEQNRQIINKWGTFFLQKSFIAGLNFFSEFIKSTGWRKHQLKRLEILYYQCCFSDENSLGTYSKGIGNRDRSEEKAFKEILAQFGNLEVDINKYSKKGEFLNADTLILIRCAQQLRVLCIDYSVFAIKSIQDLVDVDSVEVLRKLLLSEISYLKSKSVFSNLGLDTKTSELNLSRNLACHFTAFKRGDKETAKLIQAGSYTHSFSEFLRSQSLLTDETSVIFNVVGYSDRGISAMSLNRDNLDILETCWRIYKEEPSNQEIHEARKKVLKQIQRNAAKSFQNGRNFINKLSEVAKDGITSIVHQECIEGFCNSIDIIPDSLAAQLQVNPNINFRDAHAELITKALASDATYLFLTGNPGIGKTTAIVNFLKTASCLNEGFLFFYVSPRKQVNLDIIQKFKGKSPNLLDDNRIFAIHTSAETIKNNSGQYTVNYLSNQLQDNFIEQTIHFISQNNESLPISLPKNLGRLTEDQIQDFGRQNRGVLDSICQAIYTIINRDLSRNIVATVSIQSLKKTQSGKDTLEHFEKVFKDAYNSIEAIVIPARMKQISSKIKHLFIMIDEITGDDSGVEFLTGISSILKKYDVVDSQHGFNTKIIVADASIVDPDVIKQHLEETSAEPNKIFFRKAGNNLPLSIQMLQFNSLKATIINSNSYPAKKLDIEYKVFIESIKFNDKIYLTRKYYLENRVQSEIVKDINNFLNQYASEQIIVYIQDKQRLADLIEKIRDKRRDFKHYDSQGYLEIHTDSEKQKIHKYINQVKVIFMTASASRGLSFPKAKRILVDIPRFEIEKNLMEVIQVIYRGRGNYQENGVDKTLDCEDKELCFYLSEQLVYYPKERHSSSHHSSDDQQLSLQESVLNILNILLILKTSIMTRIIGSGQIGQNKFMMIPIGGKSVLAAGQTFSSKMSTLIKQLKKEQNKRRDDELLKEVSSRLEGLLSSVEINLGYGANSQELRGLSYLELREEFTTKFSQIVNNTLDGLLNFTPMQLGYINGSLLIVSLAGRAVEEKYKMRLGQEIITFSSGKLLNQMSEIKNSSTYPESIRSTINEAIELVNLLEEQPNKTQKFEQNSQYFDQYYVLPLFTFITSESMSQYFASNEEEPEDQRFRDILATYISCLYPVSNILPIGHKYKDFPWLVFRSYSLNEIRSKLFTDKYFLTSKELNVLNLILSQD